MFFREEDKIYIEVTLMSLKERICPNCNSRNVVIKDNETVKIKNSGSVKILNRKNGQLIINVIVIIHKKKYFCKDCKHTFSQQYDFLQNIKGFPMILHGKFMRSLKQQKLLQKYQFVFVYQLLLSKNFLIIWLK